MNTECDIILLSYESPDLLEKCAKSVLDYTTVTSCLIIVDNASENSDVKKLINGLKDTDKVKIERIFNEKNEGFAGGINKGIDLSYAPYVCILNNDCVVHGDWLGEMINIAGSRDNIGLVNPQSNTFGCDDPSSVSDKKGKFIELGHAIGFACLIKRKVIECIGDLDEAYQGVCYEDTDFSSQAQKAGFISVMAEGAYVFHLEQASRKGLKNNTAIYRRNREIYEKRWGRLLRLLVVGNIAGHNMPDEYELLRNLSRQRAIVERWKLADENTKEYLSKIDGENIIKHADVGIKIFDKNISQAFILWKVLTKKKKYDAVIMNKSMASGVLRAAGVMRNTKVFLSDGVSRALSSRGESFDLNDPASFADHLRAR